MPSGGSGEDSWPGWIDLVLIALLICAAIACVVADHFGFIPQLCR